MDKETKQLVKKNAREGREFAVSGHLAILEKSCQLLNAKLQGYLGVKVSIAVKAASTETAPRGDNEREETPTKEIDADVDNGAAALRGGSTGKSGNSKKRGSESPTSSGKERKDDGDYTTESDSSSSESNNKKN